MYGRVVRFRTVLMCAVGIGSIAGFFACSPSTSDELTGPKSGAVGAGSTSNGGSSNGGSTANGGNGVGGDIFGFGSTTGEGTEPDAGCVETPSQAEQVVREETHEVTHEVTTYSPLDMYIMYDQSGSMDNGGKWDAIKAALTGFVNNAGSADMGVGIGYFPFVDPAAPGLCFVDADCGAYGPCVPIIVVGYCQGADSCNPTQYATPDVPIQLLPGVGQQIIDSLNRHNPGGGTPTRPALEGAHQYAAQWAAAHPDRKTIVVLATDGDPSGCNTNTVQDSANVAAAALAATPSVPTFVIGVGNSLTSLNSIAAAGGSTAAIIVDDQSGDPTQQFIDALNQIRDSVTTQVTELVTEPVTEIVPVPCKWLIPDMPAGITFKADEVNVEFKDGADGVEQIIGHVADEAACAGVDGGWYYDSNDAPTMVLVCDQTCGTIQSVPDARVNVVFGCETKPAIPR